MLRTTQGFILLVLATLLFACQKQAVKPKDTAYYNLSGDVKSVHHSFDYSELDDPSDSFANQSLKLSFNDNGMLKEVVFNYIDQTEPESEPTIITSKYLYDSKDRLITQYDSYDEGEPAAISFLYEESAYLPYASTVYNGDGVEPQMTKFEHDSRGNLISATTVNKDLEKQSEYSATYNVQNQVLETNTSYSDRYHSSISRTYNSDNFIESETRITNDDKSVLTYEYLNTDSYGNWIKRKTKKSGKSGYVIEKRIINYY